jgi:ABC-type branched-subunit amino acid transport system substrate-binding protein
LRLQDRYPMSKLFVESFSKKFGIRPRWTAQVAYDQLAMWADACYRAKSLSAPDVIKALEEGHPLELSLGKVYYRAGDHQQVRPVPVLLGKKPADMQGKDDFFSVVEVVPGESVMQPLDQTNCKLPAV